MSYQNYSVNHKLAKVNNLVNQLLELPLSESVPCVQPSNLSFLYQANSDSNFQDIAAFRSAFASSAEDAIVYSRMSSIFDQGCDFAIMLYTWRSISRTLPFIRSADQPNRIEIYDKTIEILEPHARKLLEFMHFQGVAINIFVDEMQRLAQKDKNNCFVNQSCLLMLGKMLKMFAVLDEIKNMKASMKNDFSAYKRAVQMRQANDPDRTHEAQQLTLFLAQQKVIRDKLKERLTKISGYEDLLAEIINNNISMYESKTYVLPEEKHTLVMVIAFSLYLLDAPIKNPDGKLVGITLGKMTKRISFSKVDRIFKECEVVNLFGDMSVEPFNYIKQTPSYDPSKWQECNSSKPSHQGNILVHLPRFREEFAMLIADLAWHTNSTVVRVSERSHAENRELYDLALRGLQFLSGWSVQVLDTFSWKLLHCADDRTNPECPRDAENYEKATRYNFNSDERFALIEVIAMIKSVQTHLMRLEVTYSESIRRSIYQEFHSVIIGQLSGPLLKAQKKRERANLLRLINAIQATGADGNIEDVDPLITGDTSNGSGNQTKASSKTSNKSANSGSLNATTGQSQLALTKRMVGPSSSQLYLVRSMLELMLEQFSGKNSNRKDLDANTQQAIDNFLKQSFYWPYLMNFSGTLVKCCDLSQLWYREFFLEITNGARIQFPIEMSLPWILTDHMLKTQHAGFIECLLYPLDLYNDAAQCALNRFKRRFLYDEIEAEANLVFDQLVYKLSEQIFRHYKQCASSILLEKRFRDEAQRVERKENYPGPSRYSAALLKQRHVQLLGRNIDLSQLLCQRMNKAIHKSLEYALQHFTSGDLTSVVELELSIECTRLCHRMLAEHLKLDDFDSLLEEANGKVVSPMARSTVHIFWEITYDLVKNYCYNDATGRFVPSKLPLDEVVQRAACEPVEPLYMWGSKSLNACWEAICKLYRGFFGTPHLRAMCRLLGYQGLFVITTEMQKLTQTLHEYVMNLQSLMPKTFTVPPNYAGSSQSLFIYFLQQLRGLNYEANLRMRTHQCLRELGNMMLLLMHLEKCLTMEDLSDMYHAGPFIGQFPQIFVPPISLKEVHTNGGKTARVIHQERETMLKEHQKSLEAMNVLNLATRLEEQNVCPGSSKLAKEMVVLTRERLCCGLVVFEHVLLRMKEFLKNDSHLQPNSANGRSRNNPWIGDCQDAMNAGDILDVHGTTQFHRIWSALQFLFSLPVQTQTHNAAQPPTTEELFGEGLNWGACTIMFLLGQQGKFDILDIGSILLRQHRIDRKEAVIEGFSLERFASRLNRFSVLNRQIFSILNELLHPKGRVNPPVTPDKILLFTPPVWNHA